MDNNPRCYMHLWFSDAIFPLFVLVFKYSVFMHYYIFYKYTCKTNYSCICFELFWQCGMNCIYLLSIHSHAVNLNSLQQPLNMSHFPCHLQATAQTEELMRRKFSTDLPQFQGNVSCLDVRASHGAGCWGISWSCFTVFRTFFALKCADHGGGAGS